MIRVPYLRWLVIGLLLLGAPGAAAADEARDRAKGFNAEAKRLFALGRFAEAATNYTKAYEAKPLAVFLYNIGQCHQHLGKTKDPDKALPHLDKAVFYFTGYLSGTPDASDRKEIEQEITAIRARISTLKKEQQRRKLLTGGPVPAKPPPGTSKPIYKKWWFWTAVGAVVVGTGVTVGVVLGTRDTRVPGGDKSVDL